ncbi:uncharacterized protein LOC115048479 [Echeneis naucrates]|uniref:uncharacterized protein LOC115048479 n=1 Tax=Echeneis naucrates TaxID=173247 RepID=UPI001113AAEB|nr:uncharacterized protein LOC115048479 [Echeneis naucrates]
MVCAWTVILLHSLDTKKQGAGALCRPKELTALTKRLVENCLTSFDKANGKHLGTWSPGFPEIQVQQNTPLVPSRVQCSLLFMAQGLQEVLVDQRTNLNPNDFSLHKDLENTITQINMLSECLRHILGGKCSSNPPPPEMPTLLFERKQWSHTLLQKSREYLKWLQHNIQVQNHTRPHTTKVTNKTKHKDIAVRYFQGSGHHL